jgi:hypothetical protein
MIWPGFAAFSALLNSEVFDTSRTFDPAGAGVGEGLVTGSAAGVGEGLMTGSGLGAGGDVEEATVKGTSTS